MRHSITALLGAGLAAAAWTGTASAQSVELYVGPTATYDRYYYDSYPAYSNYGYGPRVYGYYSEREPRHLAQPEDYRTGSVRWWEQMKRTGRSGHQ